MKLHQVLMSGAIVAVTLIGITGGSVSALASSTNGSFEMGPDPGVFTTLAAGSTAVTGWEVTSGSVDYIGSYWTASDGVRSLDMSGNTAGAISQTITTIPGHTYAAAFDIAGNPAGGPSVKQLQVSAASASQTFNFDTAGKTLTAMGWTPQTFAFTATSASTPLAFTSLTAGFFGPALDNVIITDVLQNKDQCKNGGWAAYSSPSFKNQGDCVSYIQSSPNASGNRKDNL